MLGVSVDAVRSRLRRGTLEGEKIEGEWHVRLPHRQDADRTSAEPTGTQQDGTGIRPAEQQDSDRTPTDAGLTDDATATGRGQTATDPPTGAHIHLIEHMTDEIAYLRTELAQRSHELATERERSDVLQREALGRIEALTAGEIVPDTAQEAVGSPRSDDQPLHGLRASWRRLWGF